MGRHSAWTLPAATVLGAFLAFAFALMRAHGPGGLLGGVLTLAGFLTVYGGTAWLLFAGERMFLGVAAALCMWCCYGAIGEAVTRQALAERGATASCLVRDERRHVYVDQHPGATPDSPGHTTTRVEYEYRLGCDGGGPSKMTTSSSVAAEGTTVSVRWDPAGRLPLRPAAKAKGSAGPARVALVAGGLGLALASAGAVAGSRRRW